IPPWRRLYVVVRCGPMARDAGRRDSFRQAADYFVAAVSEVPADAWSAIGLGEWTVRDLVGHTGRSFRTLLRYLAEPAPEEVGIEDAVEYFAFVQTMSAGAQAAIAQRGRDAAKALGDDPLAAVVELRALALDALGAHGDDRIVKTAGGPMRLGDYIP